MLVAERGDETPIEWVHRDRRFGEKLATPDTSIADLIGEVDPIKVAEGRYLSDELTIHYGLVPRTNRGIFSINELPDLAERIQVGLLNVLEERDVQIRGYKIRLPLDLMLVASANPEDYTNRGRIITPLKDRFGAQIRTHYPLDAELEMAVVEQEAAPLTRRRARRVSVPDFMTEIVAEMSQQARRSPHVNQRSGVSVRLSIANYETLVANATRRALRNGETRGRAARQRPRRARRRARRARSRSRRSTTAARSRCSTASSRRRCSRCSARAHARRSSPSSSSAFEGGLVVHTGDDVASRSTPGCSPTLPGCAATLADLEVGESPAGVASAVEFVLEGLHLTKRLNKDAVGGAPRTAAAVAPRTRSLESGRGPALRTTGSLPAPLPLRAARATSSSATGVDVVPRARTLWLGASASVLAGSALRGRTTTSLMP